MEEKRFTAPPYDPLRLKRQILIAVFLSLGTIFLVFSLAAFRGVSVTEIDEALFRPLFLFAALGCVVAGWFVDGTRIFLTARAWGRSIRFRDALAAALSTYFMSAITPFLTGGSPAQLFVLARSGLSWGEAGSFVVICGILYQVGLLVLLVIFFAFFGAAMNLRGILLGLLYSFAIFYSTIMFLLFFFLFRPQVLFRLVDWGIRFTRRRFPKARFSEEAVRQWVETFFAEFREGFTILFVRKPQYLLWNVGCYIVYFLFTFSVAYFILQSFGLSFSYFRIVGAQIPLFFVFSFIPSPGASGGVELSIASVFRGLVGSYRLGSFVLLWRTATYYLPLFVGGIVFFRVLRGLSQSANHERKETPKGHSLPPS
ncbi:MAG: flippase-like domain-containing protein [Candidatus Caldatribacterium sp.]|uniref:lysylphosphatidylglycerol synthase transmembrane domain-containing protein n=1 Tax=Candidatus Caldatribacterium sp. TaxID=2282143 RepID=UPI00299BDA1D|nr:flippase-like domain-containing protein [Candidatus Caldatribacterium sp.]MCX7729956.1 flippase-like domain-containing protein [Candidatus Caldatribacterium sp.]MDW8081140.1 lysylphosphatidylglycerol synthase transmembrane domain-containing protein [Candidatus Calescibacterium sp.]